MFDFNDVAAENEKAREFARLKPGVDVPVKLDEMIATDDGHLDFKFIGTSSSNAGNFKPRFWAGDFDTTDPQYKGDEAAKIRFGQLKHILCAFLPEKVVNSIKGNTWLEVRAQIMKNMTPDKYKNISANMKIVYKYNSDEDIALPKFPNFISSSFKSCPLQLRNTLGQNGVPYERIKPLAEYGVVAPAAGSDTDDLPFGDTTDVKF